MSTTGQCETIRGCRDDQPPSKEILVNQSCRSDEGICDYKGRCVDRTLNCEYQLDQRLGGILNDLTSICVDRLIAEGICTFSQPQLSLLSPLSCDELCSRLDGQCLTAWSIVDVDCAMISEVSCSAEINGRVCRCQFD